MRCLVVGAGAWGLPAAAELAHRGHHVTLLDRHGIANPVSSSPGPTRLWRLTHPDAVRVRLAQRSVEAMERLSSRSGRAVFLRRGLLWRDGASHLAVCEALTDAGIEHEVVPAAEVGRRFPGLRPDVRDAVWQADAGPVLAADSMAAQRQLLEAADGRVEVGPVVRAVEPFGAGVRLETETGVTYDGDVVVLAGGPGSQPLLASVGVDVPLRPHLEQVVHVGTPPGTDDLPCLFDGATSSQPGLYSMPTPGIGYKLGMDSPLRDWQETDLDRTPDQALTDQIVARVHRDMADIEPVVVDAQVCCWTGSPDGRFVIDTVPGGVVFACGDSGEGFKFSALMGLVLADLAEGRTPDADVASFGLARFAAGLPDRPHVLGR